MKETPLTDRRGLPAVGLRLLLLPFLLSFALPAQCVLPEVVLINSCLRHPNPNGGPIDVESELIIARSGAEAVAVDELGLDLPNNEFGAENGDLGHDPGGLPYDCAFVAPNITALGGCSNVIALGPGDVLPANATVVIFLTVTSGTEDVRLFNFSDVCDPNRPIYVLQSGCARTSGAFANEAGSGDPVRTATLTTEDCARSFSYNAAELTNQPGTYLSVTDTTIASLNCSFPALPERCTPYDFNYTLCQPAGPVVPPLDLEPLRLRYPSTVLSVSFHASYGEALRDEAPLATYAGTTTAPDTLYSRITFAVDFCVSIGTLAFTYDGTPVTTQPLPGPAIGCDPDFVGLGAFDLTRYVPALGGGAPVFFYTDAALTVPIADPANYRSRPKTIYAVAGIGSCRTTPVPVVLELENGPFIAPAIDSASCDGVTDGRIDLQVTGTGPYEITWADPAYDDRQVIENLGVGNYPVTVTDAGGCTNSYALEIAPRGDSPQFGCSLRAAPSVPGAADGQVLVEVEGGTPRYRIEYASDTQRGTLTAAGGSLIIAQLAAGDYVIELFDANGCNSEVCDVEVPDLPPLEVTCTLRSDATETSASGRIRLAVEGGTPPYAIEVRGDGGYAADANRDTEGSQTFRDLPAESFTITVTDAAGSINSCEETVAAVPCPLTVTYRLRAEDCSPGSQTFASLSIDGSSGAVTTRWATSDGTPLPQFDDENDVGLDPGDYRVTVEDATACAPDTVNINVPDPTPIAFVTDPVATGPASPCRDDGVIRVTVSGGGRAPYTVQLFDFATDQLLSEIANVMVDETVVFNGLAGGDGANNYYVLVSDLDDCISDQPVEIALVAQPTPDLELLSEVTDPCAGPTDGSISLTGMGGTGPYTYEWTDYPERAGGRVLPPGPVQTDLPPGFYTVRYGDASGCTETVVLEVVDGNRPTLTCGAPVAAPPNGTGGINLTVGGGTGPYTLDYESGVRAGLTAGDNLVDGLAPGDYTAVVVDADGCRSAGCSFTIDIVGCNLTVTGTTTDGSCGTRARIELNVSTDAMPVTHRWSGGLPDSATVQPTAAGTYRVTVTDANGCIVTESFTVDFTNDRPVLAGTPVALPACRPDDLTIPVDLNGAGPFQLAYRLRFGDGTTSERLEADLAAGDSLRIPSARLSGDRGTVELLALTDTRCDQPLTLAIPYKIGERDTVRRTETYCVGQTISIGGRDFTADNPTATFTDLTVGACGSVYEVDLTFRTVVPDTLRPTVCRESEFILGRDTFDVDRPAGLVELSNPGGCDSAVFVQLDLLDLPIRPTTLTLTRCAGDPYTLGDRTFTADDPSGLAVLAGQAANGCDSLVPVAVNFTRAGEVRLVGDAALCPGDSTDLRLTYDGPGTVDVVVVGTDGSERTLTGLGPTGRLRVAPATAATYSIASALGGGESGCAATFTGTARIEVTNLTATITEVSDPEADCRDTLSRLRVDATGGVAPLTYQWSGGQFSAEVGDLPGGSYSVTVTDSVGCTAVATASVSDRSPLVVTATAGGPGCSGTAGSIRVSTTGDGLPPYSVSLDGGAFVSLPADGRLTAAPGSYRITVQDAGGCTAETAATVPELATDSLRLPELITLPLGDSVRLEPEVNFAYDSAYWSPPAGLRDPTSLTTLARPLVTTVYQLTVRSDDGCVYTGTVEVRVDERLAVFAPSAFTPNGDNVNDRFGLGYGPQVVEVTDFRVFDRWGSVVHNDPLTGWDGLRNGQPAPTGVYLYFAAIRLTDGSERTLRGDVLLMR